MERPEHDILPLGCPKQASFDQVLDYMANSARPGLLELDSNVLIRKVAYATAQARTSAMNAIDSLAADVGMHPVTLQAGLVPVFDRVTQAALEDILDVITRIYKSFGASSWTTPKHLFAIIGGRLPDPVFTVMVTALTLRIPVLLKPPSAYRAFASLLVRSFQATDPVLGQALGLITEAPGSQALQGFIQQAGTVVVFGTDDTVGKVQQLRGQGHTLVFGHRESIEVIHNPRDDGLFDAIARDVCMYDQAGCLSPHVVAIRKGIMPGNVFADRLYVALKAMEERLPPGRQDVADLARLRLFVHQAQGHLAGPGLVPNVAVVQRIYPGPGHRFVQVVQYNDIADLTRLLAPLSRHIQAFATDDPEFIRALVTDYPEFAGAHITAPGRLQTPPLIWPDDGRFLPLSLTIPLMTWP